MSSRPYRILDGKRALPHRCYTDPNNALNRAAVLIWLTPVMHTLEIVNIHSTRVLGSFTHHAKGTVTFRGNK